MKSPTEIAREFLQDAFKEKEAVAYFRSISHLDHSPDFVPKLQYYGALSAVGAPTGSECRCVPLSLSHELRVDRGRLSPPSPPYYSCWFGHPHGDPDVCWRLVVRNSNECSGRSAGWALELQLSTAVERESLFRQRPRLRIDTPRGRADAADAADGARPSQTSYVLRTVDARVVYHGQGARQPRVRLNNNFAVLGYLDTLHPVHVCSLDSALVGAADPDDDHRRLVVQVTFTVDYHRVAPVALG